MSRYILSADWHIRGSRPQYRIDDYCETLLGKIEFIVDTANKHDADIIVAGDIFNNIKVGIRVINRVIQILRKLKGTCYTVPGQHDLEGHNDTLDPTPYYNLIEAGVICNLTSNPINNIYGVGWEGKLDTEVNFASDPILVIHHCITPEEPPFFLKDSAMSAQELFDSCPEFRFIVSGDYHVPFVAELDGRYIINCGCISRSNKDQVNFEPRVYLLDSDSREINPIYIPIRPWEEVFSIPKESALDTQFSENITNILKLTESDEKPDFITTVRHIMSDEQFTSRQRKLADKYYAEVREA
jgi:exonuclease SbcD